MIIRGWTIAATLCSVALAGMALLMSSLPSHAQDAVPAVTKASATLQDWHERSLAHLKGRENQIQRERTARMDLGEQVYAISYKAAFEKDKPDVAFPVEGYIGMPLPTNCNWYHSGFLWIIVNGRDLGNNPVDTIYVAESEPRAIVDFVWFLQDMDVRLRFIGLPGGDHIVCEIAIDSPQPVKSLSIRTRCYPSFFTSYYKRTGARVIQTPERSVVQGSVEEGAGSANWWAFYRDDVFDPARGEGLGPCAMLMDPEQIETVKFEPGSYAVQTNLVCKPGLHRVRIGFWDMKGMTNAEALSNFTRSAEASLAELRNMDSTPAALTTLNLREMTEECEKALADSAIRELLSTKAEAIVTWLEKARKTPADVPGAADIATQADILTQITAYRDFVWEVRLATLISNF